MKYLYNKKNLLVSKVSDKDRVRPVLQNILFTKTGETICADGFRLVKISSVREHDVKDYPIESADMTKDVMIKTSVANDFQKVLKKHDSLLVLDNTFVVSESKDDKITLANSDIENESVNKKEVRIEDGEFPDIKQVFPKEDDLRKRYHYIRVSAKLLAEIANIIKDFRNGYDTDHFYMAIPENKTSPVYFTVKNAAEGQTLKALLMPVRDEETPEELKKSEE